MDEDTVLKTAGCKSFGGSIPSSSATHGVRVRYWLAELVCETSVRKRTYGFDPRLSPRGRFCTLVIFIIKVQLWQEKKKSTITCSY